MKSLVASGVFLFKNYVEAHTMHLTSHLLTNKVYAPRRVEMYMHWHTLPSIWISIKKILMNAFLICSLTIAHLNVWQAYTSYKINKLHKRHLRLIYSDKTLTSEELLNKGNSDTIHLRNIQNLAIGIYKIANDISSELT